jgi:hypothetical protein
LILFTASCANPKESAEYKSLANEIATLESEIPKLRAALGDRKSQESLLGAIKGKGTMLRQDFLELISDPGKRQQIIRGLGVKYCKKFHTALQETVAVVDGQGGDIFWNAVDSRIPLHEQILGRKFSERDLADGNFSDAMNKWNEELEATRCERDAADEFYSKCETVDKRLINKNPEAFRGKCIKGTVRIAQFDSNTGPCAFQGYLGGGYDVRAQFGQTLDPNTHNLETECEWTEDLVEDNYITFWGWGIGAFSYSTASGGNQTVPAFKMVMYQRG